jgi:AraC family transcriptional regulator
MKPVIKTLEEKKLIGMCLTMSLTENKTQELWKNFMLRRTEIRNPLGTELYSIQIYKPDYFTEFKPETSFEKWACLEIKNSDVIPNNMQVFTLQSGLYAVFLYKGLSSDKRIFEYIFSQWLPNSDYVLDHRPHFEVLGTKYKNNDPDSEEEIWIPVKAKS